MHCAITARIRRRFCFRNILLKYVSYLLSNFDSLFINSTKKTFHCNDLGQELGPIIKTYFASEEYATDCPKSDSIMPLPFKLNPSLVQPDPFVFSEWLDQFEDNDKFVFDQDHQMQVKVLKAGEHEVGLDRGEVWIYQLVS